MKISPQELAMRVAWPLDYKLEWFANRYAEFMIEMDGMCYRSFSAGKDSDMGCELIELIHNGTLIHLVHPPLRAKLLKLPLPPAVFSNTTNEFKEIIRHSKKREHIIIKPKMSFLEVIDNVGVAIGSKKIARMLRDLRNPTDKNIATNRLSLTGVRKDGKTAKAWKLPKQFIKAIDAPFSISEKCCDVLKKEPFKIYEKETGRKGIVFTMVGESTHRKMAYLQTGCNSFKAGSEKCKPMSIFTDADIWECAVRFNHRFAEVYYDRTEDIKQLDGTIKTEFMKAETTTGCRMCLFGLHLEDKKEDNRVQRLAISDPKFHDLVINKTVIGDVLKFFNIPTMPMRKSCKNTAAD